MRREPEATGWAGPAVGGAGGYEGLKWRQVGKEGGTECPAASGLRHLGLSEGRHLQGQGHGFGAQEPIKCRFGSIVGQEGNGAAEAVGAALGPVP